jgi:regulation of enolase protein 1 (concanavalin A-like superfamily)
MSKRLVLFLFLGLGVMALLSTPALAMTYDIRIASGADDIEEVISDGSMDDGSSDIEIPFEDVGGNDQIAGLRFQVPIPKGAQVTKAYLEFECDETKGGTDPVNVIIEGQLVPNAPAIATTDFNLSSRSPWTTAKVACAFPTWTAADQKVQLADISAIINEIINQDGWVSGNYILLTVKDDKSNPSKGTRGAEAYEGEATGAALLHIEVFTPMASVPSPADGATGVSMPLFGWTKGDGAILHNVYLGTTPDLTEANLVAKNQPFAMYYHVAGFEPGNTYYWRVDEMDAAGKVTAGPVWSFSSPSQKAFDPSPKNSAKYVAADAKLTWTPGYGAKNHTIYFGASFAEVDQASGGTPTPVPEYTPATALAKGTTYYWRVDESDGTTTYKGAVWNFTTMPDLSANDPDLIGWYMFEEGSGTKAVDFSGKGNDGTLGGGTKWVDGVQGLGLQLTSGYVAIDGIVDDMKSTNVTFSAWVKTTQTGEGELFAGNDSGGGHPFMFGVWNGVPFTNDGSDTYFTPLVNDDQWHMLTYVRNGSAGLIYVDGVQTGSYTSAWSKDTITLWSIGQEWDPPSASNFLNCTVDDVRVYNKPLTADEVKELMRGDPTLAWKPSPDNKATIDVIKAEGGLTWAAGDNAKQHDVYLGLDKAAVDAATTANKTGVYRGRQTEASYTPPEGLPWGTGPYYWRIDEVQDNGSVSMGAVWSFSIADFLIVDDMETYTDEEGSRIYEIWIDGWTNNTGAVVGNLTAPFAERTIVHSGSQAMPMDYNNAKTPFYSEAELTFSPLQNWTTNDVTTLTVWVRGNPVRFVDQGNGAFTVGASGHDIWDNADDFRFVYKRLNGDGSIQVKVESLVNTNAWAKAGVMIRDSLDAGSQMAYMIQSFSSGVSFGWRQNMGLACGSATQAGVVAPQWVKLTRKGNAFTAQYSADGKTWTDIKDATTGQVVSTTIGIGANCYIGLCVTSHNTAATTTAEFSGAATTGGVTGTWQQAWIGDDPDRTNGADKLYVAVEDSAGKVAVASDPTLVNAGAWTEWQIPLSSFTGVNLAKVKTLYIGVGDRKNPVAGGAGRIYIDDIRLTKP